MPVKIKGSESEYRHRRLRDPGGFDDLSFRTVPVAHMKDIPPDLQVAGNQAIVGAWAGASARTGPRGGRDWRTQAVLVPKDRQWALARERVRKESMKVRRAAERARKTKKETEKKRKKAEKEAQKRTKATEKARKKAEKELRELKAALKRRKTK